ncbi:MAG: DUF86 domain-containing protein [Bacillota bacterium]|jgi:uncharacterized protein with HEPN domain
MNGQRTNAVLRHMLEDIRDSRKFIQGLDLEAFRASSLVKKGVSMSLINIGELARQLPDELLARHPEIPWGSVVALRNRAAHGYHELDPEIIWTIVKSDLIELERAVCSELQANRSS